MIIESKKSSTSPMLLTSKEAAEALSISERTLFTLTKSGKIPPVRIGRAVRYDPRDLQAMIDKAKMTDEDS